jgi:hypothetical protein
MNTFMRDVANRIRHRAAHDVQRARDDDPRVGQPPVEVPAPMNADAALGRRQIIGIAASVWLPPLIGQVLDGGRFGSSTLLGAALPLVLLWGLARGWEWARSWTIVTLGVGAVAATVGVVVADTVTHSFASGLTAVGWAAAGWVLAKSESIDAYCEYQQDEGTARR